MVTGNVPSKAQLRNRITHNDRLRPHKAIGTSDNLPFPVFASLANTWYEGQSSFRSRLSNVLA